MQYAPTVQKSLQRDDETVETPLMASLQLSEL